MTAGPNHASLDAEQIVDQMRLARSAGGEQVVELRMEAKRLFDWSEYVRAMPILSMGAASLIGFSVVSKVTAFIQRSNPPEFKGNRATGNTQSLRATMVASLSTLAMSVVSNAIKSYLGKLTQRKDPDGE
jgi:hypothetical protein